MRSRQPHCCSVPDRQRAAEAVVDIAALVRPYIPAVVAADTLHLYRSCNHPVESAVATHTPTGIPQGLAAAAMVACSVEEAAAAPMTAAALVERVAAQAERRSIRWLFRRGLSPVPFLLARHPVSVDRRSFLPLRDARSPHAPTATRAFPAMEQWTLHRLSPEC